MSPGVAEETGKSARSFFEVLREQPLSLALVVMNFALLTYLFWSGKETLGMAYKAQTETQLLLDKCFSKGHQ
jgi:hypothetical protein